MAAASDMAPFRPATLEERRKFYEREFSVDNSRRASGAPQFFAIDAGTESGIIIDKRLTNRITIFPANLSWDELARKLRAYLPEDAYYDTTRFPDAHRARRCATHQPVCSEQACGNWGGRELVFDVDSENIDCPRCGFGHGKFCRTCLRIAFESSDALASRLESSYGFEKFLFVYSGRGMHLHVRDERAYALLPRERQALVDSLKGFPIDPWVTVSKRWIRLPFSLHGLVSRITIPLEREELRTFDPTDDERAVPDFLKH